MLTVLCSHVVGDAPLVIFSCRSWLKQLLVNCKNDAPSCSSVVKNHWLSNCSWYSSPSAQSWIMWMCSEAFSHIILRSPQPSISTKSPSSSSSSTSSHHSASLFGDGVGCVWFGDLGCRMGWSQKGIVRFCLTLRKNIGGTGGTAWTRCLQSSKWLVMKYGQVQFGRRRGDMPHHMILFGWRNGGRAALAQ